MFYLFIHRTLSICHIDGIYIIIYVVPYSCANSSKLSEYLLNAKGGIAYQTFFHLVLIPEAQLFCIKHSEKEIYILKCNSLPLK